METEKPSETHFDGIHCHLTLQQYGCGVVVLKISGTDVGEFGNAPMLAMDDYLHTVPSIELFIDARDVRGASIEVSGEWAAWLSANREKLRDVSMLTGSRFIKLTADFVRRFADLQGVMKIYTEDAAFDSALEVSLFQNRRTAAQGSPLV